ncbi:ABC transporter permease subunit [Rubrobacter tropicus]|uniref:ABC transporter permease subunit n=1 Tax=Rubrobacter tropicus TaxID=2653851 RepID=A0A6G8Q4Y1_9ACTN|nr:carbohydrate ABC transporter permease [Rubrobacter tropicus]QIN81554.1 ABC transporter permease subunit [Rubrobacter tropicus]
MATQSAAPTEAPAGKRGAGAGWRALTLHALLIGGAVIMLYPLLWMFASSLKPADQIFSDLSLIPREIVLSNYVDGWFGAGTPFSGFFLNSFVVCAGAVVGNVFACSMAAYAFARLDFRFKGFWFAMMLLTIMLPQHVTLIPQYTLFLNLDWVNTFLPLIVPKFLATDAFFIFLMVQFIRGIPRELDDAAKVDGCGPFSVYWRIIVPLLLPALVTTAIFTFLWTYDDFFSQLIYLSDTALYTVPLGLRLFLDSTGDSQWGPMFAMSVLSLAPTFLFFLFFQRLIVEGISTTGLKG